MRRRTQTSRPAATDTSHNVTVPDDSAAATVAPSPADPDGQLLPAALELDEFVRTLVSAGAEGAVLGEE